MDKEIILVLDRIFIVRILCDKKMIFFYWYQYYANFIFTAFTLLSSSTMHSYFDHLLVFGKLVKTIKLVNF